MVKVSHDAPDFVQSTMISNLSSLSLSVSFDEFKQLFRKNNSNMARQVEYLDSSVSTFNESGLVGLDAKIPGGKFDQ